MTEPAPIPAFVNPRSGSAAASRAAIEADARFAVHDVAPERLAEALRAEIARGTPRVLVAGGDGTLATAARALAGSATALAVLPGGTLNHFARDLGLPTDDPAACLDAAARGTPRPTDAAYVNDQLFLGTSSVGVYVTFVRARERLERWCSYRVASVLAAVRVWLSMRTFTVVVREGERASDAARPLDAALVFIAVGERALEPPGFGVRLPGGAAKLQLVVVRERSRLRLVLLAARVATLGLRGAARGDALDVSLVEACEIRFRRPWGRVAMDGELTELRAPLRYRIAHGALLAVVPPAEVARDPRG